MFVKQWEEKTTKLNFFSMYFVRTNEEIHLSFKNSEKQRTEALNTLIHPESELLQKDVDFDRTGDFVAKLLKN